MFLKYVDSHTTSKMQCSLSHSMVQYLALKSDAIYTSIFFFLLNTHFFVGFLRGDIWTCLKPRFWATFCSLVSSKKSVTAQFQQKNKKKIIKRPM